MMASDPLVPSIQIVGEEKVDIYCAFRDTIFFIFVFIGGHGHVLTDLRFLQKEERDKSNAQDH